jgi:hypothetical protein
MFTQIKTFSVTTLWYYVTGILLCILISPDSYSSTNLEVGEKRSFSDLGFHFETETAASYSRQPAPVPDSILNLINKINALGALVTAENRFISKLDEMYQVRYPVGISKTIGGLNYTIVLESDVITTEGAFINAYMSFTIPQNGKTLAFAANRIPLSAEGGINGVVELALLNDEPIDISNSARLIIFGKKQQARTKVHFDCNGFIDMVIDAGIEFSKNTFVPEDPLTGKQLTNQLLTAGFVVTVQSWSDMIVQVSLPPFQLASLKGFGFEVQQASFDFSDLNNPAGIVFPDNYAGLQLYAGHPQLWQGFYFRQVIMRLPAELNNGVRMAIMAQNLVIDDLGLSGTFAAENLLPIDKGSIGGWAFSIDRVQLKLVANSVTNAGISGKINMPVMDSSDFLAYNALIDQKGDFLFTASMPKSFKVPLFVADMVVYQTSSLTIAKENDKYEVLATLNGQINVNATLSGNNASSKGFKVDSLKFENMQLCSKSPYFRPGVWSLGKVGFSSMNGFSLSLSNVEGFEQADDVGLKFTATVKLSGEKYVASTTLKIIGSRVTETTTGEIQKHKLRYKKTELQDLYISVKASAISLVGYLAIYKDDPIFGNGYAGMVKATVIDKFGVQVKAVFGEVNGFKYWYADALANFSASPIPIFTGISMYGIGGGAYYHMIQKKPDGIPFANSKIEKAKSVINYVPDETVFMGFKATIAIGSSSPQGFNAMATFEIVFNTGGGVREVMFYGQGCFMSKMDLDNPPTDAPISASVYIGMDFENSTFHGSFKVYVNALGGMLTGINPGNLAGEMVIHADPSDWYIHIGRPSARIGLKLQVFGITIQNGSYFMMGTKIEVMPPPPEQVLRILQLPIPDNRNVAEMMSARGFAFGTYFSISTGDKTFGIFYARFDMGLGFDVMLSDKGETFCSETGDKIGINGWYAEGQLYAFLEGAIGIDIKVFRIKVHQEILNIGAAILLEAKLPNPFWMRGTVGGYYSLMGGRVSGQCRFQLEMGSLCTLVTKAEDKGSPVEGLQVISELSPGDGRKTVDVFTTPQLVFNYQIGQPFKISDSLTNNDQYKIILDYFNIKANNAQLPGSYEWNKHSDVLVFNPRDILPGTTSIILEAKVHFEQLTGGTWQVVKDNGAEICEIKKITFETGEAPDYIPENNVSHSYPLKDMMNLYKNEFSNGYIQLKQGQEYLFNVSAEWKQYGRFTAVKGGAPVYVAFGYEAGNKKINHIIPAALANNTIYKFELVNLPASVSVTIDANIKQKTEVKAGTGGDVIMKAKVAETTRSDMQEKVIYTCYFRSSIYNSLASKISSISKNYTVSNNAGFSPLVFNLKSILIISEPFDKYEIIGGDNFEPLLLLNALTSGKWINDRQIPFIYADYPIMSKGIITHRDISVLGFIPVKRVYIDMYKEPYRLLTDLEKSSGNTNFTLVDTYISYNLSPETWCDYQDIAAILSITPGSSLRKTQILTGLYPSIIINANYPINAQYQLPFINLKGSNNTINVTY